MKPSSVVVPALILALSASFALAAEPPAKAIAGDVVTDYQGIRIADPYRALEDVSAPSTKTWASAQSTWTREQLDRLPGLTPLRARIDALDADQSPVISALKVTPRGQVFYLKRMPGQSYTKLYTRKRFEAPETLLLDPEAWKQQTGIAHAINNYTVAPDGRHVAAVISKADAELGDLEIFDVATGQQVLPAVPGIWGELPAAWSRDSRSVQYMQGLTANDPQGLAFGKMQVFERRLAGGADRKLLGWHAGYGMDVGEKDWVYTDPSSSPRHTYAALQVGVSANLRVAAVRTSDLSRDAAKARWFTVFGDDAGVRGVAQFGRWIYARTFDGASRYRIVRYNVDRPEVAPVEIVPQQRGVLEEMTAASDGLYYTVRSGSVMELFRVGHATKPGPPLKVALPFVGSVGLFDGDPEVRGVNFTLEGWTRPREVLHADGPRVQPTGLVALSDSPVGKDWESEEATCTGHDGVEVPMSIVYKRGLVKDGSHPTLMDGYGGYGISEPAYFNRRLDPWLQRGGIFVDVKPRGGGAYGRDWYQAGVGAKKSNTWKDMIACGEALIARGYTSTPKLAIQGTSMGGVAVGRAITERPDLFGVAIVRVGITDTIRFVEATSNGPNHEDEMGTVKTADGVRQLLAMSTYAQIVDGTKYPAMLFTAGMNDNRVAPWISFKTFARMAAASGSGRPVLLRIEGDGGHGMSTTAAQRNAEYADRVAFMLWNMGDAEFQPRP